MLPVGLQMQLWEQARQKAPCECVGVLGGQISSTTTHAISTTYMTHTVHTRYTAQILIPLVNMATDTQKYYQVDMVELLRTLKAWRQEGLEWVGLYHSHPCGEARPSAEDLAFVAQVPQIILGGTTQELAVFLW